jgi:hypothetical protein
LLEVYGRLPSTVNYPKSHKDRRSKLFKLSARRRFAQKHIEFVGHPVPFDVKDLLPKDVLTGIGQ